MRDGVGLHSKGRQIEQDVVCVFLLLLGRIGVIKTHDEPTCHMLLIEEKDWW